MANWLKSTLKAVSEKGGLFMFLRAQLSAQLSTVLDFFLSVVLVAFFGMYYVFATVIGSICGGVVNYIVNYNWTFKASGVNKLHAAGRYALIWCVSIFLNTLGIYLLIEMVQRYSFLAEYSTRYFDDIFVVCKIIISVLVGFTWNYYMQRIFVYKRKKL